MAANEGPQETCFGWWMVASCFLLYIINAGCFYSNGLLLPDFMEAFKAGEVATTWLASGQVGFCLCSGTMAGALIELYGCRTVCLAGSFIAAMGYAISAYVTNLWIMYFSFSIIPGLCLGLQFLPAIVMVQQYFHKRRALATGIAVSGAPVGTFLYAMFVRYLLDTYGWRGTILIMGGMLLNAMPLAALARPKEDIQPVTDLPLNDDVQELTMLHKGHPYPDTGCETIIKDDHLPKDFHVSVMDEDNHVSNNGSAKTTTLTYETTSTETASKYLDNNEHQLANHTKFNGKVMFNMSPTTSICNGHGDHLIEYHKVSIEANGKNYEHYTPNETNHGFPKSSDMSQSTDKMPYIKEKLLPNNCKDNVNNQKVRIKKNLLKEMSKVCQTTAKGFLQLRQPTCLVVFSVYLVVCLGLNTPFVFVPIKAIHLGLDNWSTAMLISIVGISDAIGRVSWGLIAHFCKKIDKLILFTVCIFSLGVWCTFLAIVSSYYSLVAGCALYGFSLGGYIAMMSPSLVDLLGLDRIASVLGLMNVAQGLGLLIAPPIQASILKALNSANAPFYFGGAAELTSSLVLFLFHIFSHYSKSREQNAEEKETIDDMEDKIDLNMQASDTPLNKDYLKVSATNLTPSIAQNKMFVSTVFGSTISISSERSQKGDIA